MGSLARKGLDNLSLKEPKTIPELSKLLDEDPKRFQSVLKHLIKENLVKPIKLRTAAKKCCHLTNTKKLFLA